MKNFSCLFLATFVFPLTLCAQNTFTGNDSYNEIDGEGNYRKRSTQEQTDSLGSDKEIPKGLKVWTVDSKFGDIAPSVPDTLSHTYPNGIFTSGKYGEYNTLGNVGSPRINRIFIDRYEESQFVFIQPYDFFVKPVNTFHFTNTLSPFTNLTYNTCGNRTNGEDHLTAKFGVNAGKRLGVGFHFDYIYGRGYYQNQSTSHFNYTMYGSYLGDRYQAHVLLSTNHQKVAENGGVTNDAYITHPESFNDNFSTNEIPTVLEQNWNRNDNQHIFVTQRYNVGFQRKVKMSDEEIKARKFAIESKRENDTQKRQDNANNTGRTTENKKTNEYNGRPSNAKIAGDEPAMSSSKTGNRIAVKDKNTADSLAALAHQQHVDTTWMKTEYVPVTSFIHTLKLDNYKRIYQAYMTPSEYYADTYNSGPYGGDSIYDQTRHFRLSNTFAIALLEGFNKWAKAGMKIFATSDLRHFTLPKLEKGTTDYTEHNLSIGGLLNKTMGRTLHYNAMAEAWIVGKDAGQLNVDATTDLNFRLWGDTLTLKAHGFFKRINPGFYYRHYHSRHFWWDNENLDKTIHTRIEGSFYYQKTHTALRIAFDELKNHTYMAMNYVITDEYGRTGQSMQVRQKSGALSLFTVELKQDFALGALHWENILTYQKSTDKEVLPVPDLNVYSNLFLRFKIAHVLKCDFGTDVRYFTKYYAPDYCPALGQYAVQEGSQRTQTGGYPFVNIYANFHLKQTRFFIMMSHVNSGNGTREYFLTPHYPTNPRIFRFGVSWNFFN